MKTLAALALPLLTATLLAQSPVPSACGPEDARFKVKTAPGTDIPAPPAGAAQVIFLQDQVEVRPGQPACPLCKTQVQLGMDGNWVGATSGFSHIVLALAPGEHHFCVTNPRGIVVATPLPSFYALTLQAGKTYYLRARLLYPYKGFSALELGELNPDEGRALVSASTQSTFTIR